MTNLKLEMINNIKLNEITILICAKFYFLLILINLIVNHFQKLIYISAAVSGFLFFLIKKSQVDKDLVHFLKSSRLKCKISSGLVQQEAVELSGYASESTLDSASLKFDQKSLNLLNIKPSLSGLYLVDDELHKIIDLLIRDFVDYWYKTSISKKDEFSNHIRALIYFSIKQINQCLKQIHWDNFVTNVLVQNLLIQIRIFKKSRERARSVKKSELNSTKNNQSYDQLYKSFQTLSESNKTKFVECFFDTEADHEKTLCRDNICFDQKEDQNEFLQELSEMLCFCLMPSKTFNCLPLRCLLREIFAHVLVKGSIERLTDPDYINQSILYLSQDFVPSTENFMTTINFCENLDELNELSLKIEKEIALTRSNDLGGNNVNDIKLQLSSLSYLKKKIDTKISNLVMNAFKVDKEQVKEKNDESYQQAIDNLNIDTISLESILQNERTQNCFIEFMSKKNVQNLISFYLNAEMYRQFAAKELSKAEISDDSSSIKNVKNSLRDYSKSLIDSYILNASNFSATTQDEDDEPVNIANFTFYKKELSNVLEKLENIDLINERLFDDLQSKIYILMDDRYLNDFKKSTEFHKILIKYDLKFSIDSEFEELEGLEQKCRNDDEALVFSDSDSISVKADQTSLNGFDLCAMDAKTENNDPKYLKINACIISTGRCNELKKTYSIYIMDVTKLNESNGKVEYWQTYRRFNDFHDFHLILKKNFPDLNIPSLPGKSFRNSLNDDLVEKRINELNKYLKIITDDEITKNNPDLLELVEKFLENRRWEYSSPTSFKRRFDSILSPMINSVQTIQTSIKNAPDNVIGIVKGISDNLINESPSSKANVLKHTNLSGSQSSLKLIDETTHKIVKSKSSDNESQILNLDDLKSNNIPFKMIILLIDEIFDLKEKNQWLRQSLMAIVKSILKNFKGDSMNRKIREQISIYLDEQSLARYLKNFRKRIWPQGVFGQVHPARAKSVQELTKLLVKTKLLSIVTDDLRHILGNDVTRRGVFTLFDLFQHKSLNKRLLYVIMENLIDNLFFNTQINSALLPLLYKIPMSNMSKENLLTPSPLDYMLHLHLSKSFRVKSEWKVTRLSENRKQNSNQESNFMALAENEHEKNKYQRNSLVPRSKSLYNEIKC